MINLLPDNQKEMVRREYLRRRLIVIEVFFITLSLFATILLIPAYFASEAKFKSLKEQAGRLAASETEKASKEMVAEAAEVKRRIGLLEQKVVKAAPFIAAAIAKKDEKVIIRSISYEHRGETARIDLRGVAQTRDGLLSFVERLKKESEFDAVHSPVSNLVKDRNIEFMVEIAIAP